MKSKLEKIADAGIGAVKTSLYAGGITAAAVAVVGAIAAGIYEGGSGQKLLGAENPSMAIAAGAGYIAFLLPAVAEQFHKSDEQGNCHAEDGLLLGALICPIGPVAGMISYGIGYGMGKLFA
jgi:hypothetical protein